jgi:hypothetical protein
VRARLAVPRQRAQVVRRNAVVPVPMRAEQHVCGPCPAPGFGLEFRKGFTFWA